MKCGSCSAVVRNSSRCDDVVGRAQELKEHPYFVDTDWQQVYLQKIPPPLIPPRGEVNAADAFDIGSFDEEDTKGIKVRNGGFDGEFLAPRP